MFEISIGLHGIFFKSGIKSGEMKFLFEPVSIKSFALIPLCNIILINGNPFIAFTSHRCRFEKPENLLPPQNQIHCLLQYLHFHHR